MNLDGLRKAIEVAQSNRGAIENAVRGAEDELQELRSRVAELESLIAEARAILGQSSVSGRLDAHSSMTLHDAMAMILRENSNVPITANELTRIINSRGLYQKRDGTPVDVSQIHARAKNYEGVFYKNGSQISLRDRSEKLITLPDGIIVFVDDDDGFSDWLSNHSEGYVVNCHRSPKPTYLVLHKPACRHFKGGDSLHWTRDYAKVCSLERGSLEHWAESVVGGQVTLCRDCFGHELEDAP